MRMWVRRDQLDQETALNKVSLPQVVEAEIGFPTIVFSCHMEHGTTLTLILGSYGKQQQMRFCKESQQ